MSAATKWRRSHLNLHFSTNFHLNTYNKILVLYDGKCGLCNLAIKFIRQHDHKKIFLTLPLQDYEDFQFLPQQLSHVDSVWVKHHNHWLSESSAVFEIFTYLGFPYSILSILKILPVSFTNAIYRWIARHRYQWFGRKNESCDIEIGSSS